MAHRTPTRIVLVLGVALAVLGATVGPALAAGPAGQTTPDTGTTLAAPDACSFPVTRTDATGTTVTVPAAPETVVTLAPSAAQTMWEIGAREKVIGVSKYATYLEGAASRTNVSGAGRAFVVTEKVVNLTPDLVLAPNVIPNATVRNLRSAGLTVYKFRAAQSLADIVEKTRLTGRLVGACEGADRRADAMERTLSRIRETVADTEEPRVLYYMGGGFTAGSKTFIHTIIESAGAENVAANAGIETYRRISREIVLTRNPQWIVKGSSIAHLPRTQAYNETIAVETGQVVTVNADYLSQPAPRTVRVVRRLAETFHPDAFAAAGTATATETTSTRTTTATEGTPQESATTRTTTATTPGLGIPIAVLSMLLVGRFLHE